VYKKLGSQPDVDKLNVYVIITKIRQERNPSADFTHKTVKEKIGLAGSQDNIIENPGHKTKADYRKKNQRNNRPY
jgi:hypothetical protein